MSFSAASSGAGGRLHYNASMLRSPLLSALLLPLSWTQGCAATLQTTGVVHAVSGGAPVLETMGGQEYRLSSADAEAFAALQDCTLEVEGRRVGGTIYVHDWRVTDSSYGPGVFVGIIREWGAVLAVEDRNTGSTLAFAAESGEALRPYVGRMVLVVGPVVGDRQIQVVAFRVLTAE